MAKGDLLGVRHPWFRPLWRRVALTGGLAGWACVEAFAFTNAGWFWIFMGAAIYCAYHFFLTFDPQDFGDDP